ncbi:MAG: ABC transporter ATP-binding protein [Oscillospiraceae bacterium]|jgi:ATP-binding cassette subfamily B protein|nr:ABC transporter ATP-binding protein [Oscillospiraceae bacterium]
MARNKYDVDERLETPFSFQHLKRSGVYIKHYSGKMIFAFLINTIGILLSLLTPMLTQQIMDVFVPEKNVRGVIFFAVLVMLALAGQTFMTTIRSRIMTKVGQGIIYEIRTDLFLKLQQLPFSYYDNRPHGKILVRVVQYVNNVSDMLSNGIINFILDLLNLIFIACFMFAMHAGLALIIVSGLPVLAVIIFSIKPRQRRAWQTVSNKNSNLNAYLQETITGMKVTQIFNREEVNQGIFTRLCEGSRASWVRAAAISNLVWVSVDNISTIVLALVCVVGVLVYSNSITFGILWAMSRYSSRFWQPITNLSNIYNNFLNTIAYLERIFETMDEPVEIHDVPDAVEMPKIKGDVEFKDVVFAYEKDSPDVLKGLSFQVKAGQSVAIVGPTGAGKTTIVNLISRFYNLKSGQVLIDGQDISKVTLHSLRSQMGIMLQDTFIFSGTIADNVRYGKLDATQEEIEAACKTVSAHDFIVHSANGYQTEVRERGSSLSQGQRQLLSFARTLISDPKVLVLDEATSAIDAKTEQLVQQGINELLKGRTSFIIAHRLSTIKSCDIIMYIADGRIVEQGNHQELMAKKGEYYRLYTSQIREM